MIDPIIRRALRRFARPALAMVIVLATGTVGYEIIGGPSVSWVDAFYMTFITVSTIGYAEIIDMTGRPGARLFTVGIALAGMGVITYILSNATAYIVEGEMNQELRRRKMLKRIAALRGHYIVCGTGRVGTNVINELVKTERAFVAIESSREPIDALVARHPGTLHLQGDASEDELLAQAGMAHAAGVFAVTGDDSKNLVITLTARQMRADCRIVARCHELNYFSKMQKVGADAIVSPDFTGGMRIVSSMIRPQVVSFLDEMLRTENNVRVEEVAVAENRAGGRVDAVAPRCDDYILLAVKREGKTVFNPSPDLVLTARDTLVVMATPAGRRMLETRVGAEFGA